MKARITKDGKLVIKSQMPIEAYARRQWCEDNTKDGKLTTENLLIDHGKPEKGQNA